MNNDKNKNLSERDKEIIKQVLEVERDNVIFQSPVKKSSTSAYVKTLDQVLSKLN